MSDIADHIDFLRLEGFAERAGFSEKDLRKGQSIQWLRAMQSLSCAGHTSQELARDRRENGVSIDQVIEKIIDDRMWWNPHFKRTGVGNDLAIHSCKAWHGYKHGGETVMNMDRDDQKKAIKTVLQSNVLNKTDYHYRLAATDDDPGRARRWSRNADNSVFAHGMNACEELPNGNIRFSQEMLDRLDRRLM
jgi:hypothetical protein